MLVILLNLGKALGRKKGPKPLSLTKNPRTTHGIWQMLFSMTQSGGIKNCDRLQRFSLSLFPSVTRFFLFARQDKICMIRKKTQKVLHNCRNIFK